MVSYIIYSHSPVAVIETNDYAIGTSMLEKKKKKDNTRRNKGQRNALNNMVGCIQLLTLLRLSSKKETKRKKLKYNEIH